mgnify:FL=1
MATNLNVFLREKISELNTPDTFFEYSSDYTIKSYAKRQLYVTGSYSTTIATFCTQSNSDFESISYGRVSNLGTYDVEVKFVNQDDDLFIYKVGPSQHLMVNNVLLSNFVGSTESLKQIEAKVAAGTARKIKVEYFFSTDSEDI